MKKLTLIISALALVLGMSQCKKPNQPIFGGGTTSTKTITFSTGNNGGAKGDFDQVDELLKYKWDENNDKDVIHVYIQNGGDEFTGGDYLGTMEIAELSADGYEATFKGSFTTEFPENGWIRFVHYGHGITVNADGSMNETVSFATQDGTLPTISDKVVAVCTCKIDENCTYKFENQNLTVQFAVVKFTLEVFEGNDNISVTGLEKNGLTVNANGAVVYTGGTTATLGDITVENKDMYYTVFMPKANTTYIFNNGSKTKYKTAKIDAGVFYTKTGDAGASATLDNYPEGVLPGVFSVSATRKVHFSKGNLWYGTMGSSTVKTFNFEDKQFGYSSADPYDQNHVSLFLRGGADENYGTGQTLINYQTYMNWGENPISNGGNIANFWSTLNSTEIGYVMSRNGGTKCGLARVYNNDNTTYNDGLVLLPDTWVLPEGCHWTNRASIVNDNTYTAEQWVKMEKAGAVLLPMAGNRQAGTGHVYDLAIFGGYWASSGKGVVFENGLVTQDYVEATHNGGGVRLVCNHVE